MSEWQPIETAPKAMAVLVFFPDGRMDVCYQTDAPPPMACSWRYCNCPQGEQAPWPTLWMPLPLAPR